MLTVIDEAPSPDLATLATVKAALGITGTEEDNLLKVLITAASATIAIYCNRVLVEEGVSETFHDRTVMLSRYPISELSSVVENGLTLSSAEYEADLATGIIERLFGIWGRIVVVQYISGYTLDVMPRDIVQALVLLVAHYRSKAGRDPLIRSETIEGAGSTDYFGASSGDLPADVEGLLTLHRKPNG